MSFRTYKNKMGVAPHTPVYEVQSRIVDTEEDGVIVKNVEKVKVDLTDSSSIDMPNPEDFSLENQLASGVSLQEVSTKILSAEYEPIGVADLESASDIDSEIQKFIDKNIK